MVINLNIKDRLTLISILPTSGKIVELVEVMEIVKMIKFSEEERQRVKYKEDNGRVYWDPSLDIGRDFEFTYEQVGIIKDAVKKLDEEDKVTLSTLDTCLKFSKL